MNDERLVVEGIFVCGTFCTKPVSGELIAMIILGVGAYACQHVIVHAFDTVACCRTTLTLAGTSTTCLYSISRCSVTSVLIYQA